MFNGKEGGLITLAQAQTLTGTYRTAFPTKIKGAFFGKNIINDLLNQTGAVGIRTYMGEENGDFKYVMVAVDANENDIIGKIADMAMPCPTYCSGNGGLR